MVVVRTKNRLVLKFPCKKLGSGRRSGDKTCKAKGGYNLTFPWLLASGLRPNRIIGFTHLLLPFFVTAPLSFKVTASPNE